MSKYCNTQSSFSEHLLSAAGTQRSEQNKAVTMGESERGLLYKRTACWIKRQLEKSDIVL